MLYLQPYPSSVAETNGCRSSMSMNWPNAFGHWRKRRPLASFTHPLHTGAVSTNLQRWCSEYPGRTLSACGGGHYGGWKNKCDPPSLHQFDLMMATTWIQKESERDRPWNVVLKFFIVASRKHRACIPQHSMQVSIGARSQRQKAADFGGLLTEPNGGDTMLDE